MFRIDKFIDVLYSLLMIIILLLFLEFKKSRVVKCGISVYYCNILTYSNKKKHGFYKLVSQVLFGQIRVEDPFRFLHFFEYASIKPIYISKIFID